MHFRFLFCVFAALGLAALFPVRARGAEAPKPRNGPKLIITNDDGFSSFYAGLYKNAEDLRQRVRRLSDTQIGVFEWCIAAGSRVNYPSKATDLIGAGVKAFPRRGDQLAAETLQRFVTEGIDTLDVVAKACREVGIACYASYRMNGDYAAVGEGTTLAHTLNSTFWWERPELRVRGKKGEDLIKLSYSFPEVRAFKLNVLREVAAHDIDGINLDFLRHPKFFGYEEPLVKEFQARYGEDPRTLPVNDARWLAFYGDIMTGFVRDVRKILDEAGKSRGRRLGLSVRTDWKDYKAWGCDLETWLKEDLLDYCVLAQHTLGGYEFDLKPFVALAKGRGCAVLFGEEAITSGHDVTPAEDKLIAAGKMPMPARGHLTLEKYHARAARWYAAGADGVHLFNEGNPAVFRSLGSVPAARATP